MTNPRDYVEDCEAEIYKARCARSTWAGVVGVSFGCLVLLGLYATGAGTPGVIIAVLTPFGVLCMGAILWIWRTRCASSSQREHFEASPATVFEWCNLALDRVAPSCRSQDLTQLTTSGITEMWFWSLGERLRCDLTPSARGCEVEVHAEAIMGSSWGSRQSQTAATTRVVTLVRSFAEGV